MQGNTKKNKETKSGPFKAKGISITKGVASRSPASKSISIKVPGCKQTSATKTSIGGSGPSGVAAKSKGAYKLKGSKEGKLPNGLSKNVSGGSVPACSRAKTAKTKVLMKKVKKLKMGKLSQGKSTEPNGKKVKMINSAITSQAKLSTRASSTSSSTTTSPVKLSSSSSVASRRDSWLYRCLDEYDHRGQSDSFEPFFLTETIVIKHSQSELDKLIDIDAALCDRTQIQWQQQAPPQTGSINSTSQAVPNGPSVVSAPPPKMSIGKKLATGGVNTFEHVPQFDKSNVEEKQTSPTADRKRRNDRRAERNPRICLFPVLASSSELNAPLSLDSTR